MIAFTSDRGGSQQIYVMNADGSGQTQLTSGFVRADGAAWSPDGRRIAFAAWRTGGNGWQMHVMNADGSGQVLLAYERALMGPRWSPDGKQVACTNGGRIFVIKADGSGSVQSLTETWTGIMGNADWSPDGTKIVFAGRQPRHDEKGSGLFVIDAGGSDITRLTRGHHENPVWSPDGQKIAFNGPNSLGVGTYICLVNADGSAATVLTVPGAQYATLGPEWSPDGTKIAFHMQGENNYEIYRMNADGSGLTRLTSAPGSDIRPNWGKSYVPPRGRRIRDAVDTSAPGGSTRAPGGVCSAPGGSTRAPR